ncbi:tRNA (adenosine(37)-N6)-threonylcarbamoyltransferase complex dimerization subunit type 1 TsaB [Spiroplasma sp. BIUS-1]|uniref:tRNA (adenosine(37)-N6)-threonylcarbamoyltransferase complex dimerization subunit type 1 TsaB n=1 Tax=Spiroplasma sp. BIUS-1 TaxID=216964 RepID=UPI0013973F52|nr:tRNA (adenosine(37)-N6)-threonylcarbamoyltransferase complex dimerization subunit type 1 TsaB [Spiroplasma sp. BIUS-1]QHX36408.1 tRNA threonylcarbamoyladenosine biosynthesis protein TsaB [Spiroplasma sp. BIUS-1]
MNLFIDTSNNKLIFILEKDNKIIDSFFLDNQIRISDIALEELQKFLNKNNLTIHDIKSLYATKGPGSYTGVRVAITIIKTLKTVNEKFKVFLLSSLAYQASNKKTISILDAKGSKIYIGIYQEAKNIIEDQIIPLDYLEEFEKQFKDFNVVKDYKDIDFKECFLLTKDSFQEIKNVEDIKPLYIKHFI